MVDGRWTAAARDGSADRVLGVQEGTVYKGGAKPKVRWVLRVAAA